MISNQTFIGSPLKAYSAADFAAGGGMLNVPMWNENPAYPVGFYRWLKNGDSVAITAKQCAAYQGTDYGLGQVHVSPATLALENFAGVRIPNAASLPAGGYGLFQTTGLLTSTRGASGANTAANAGVVLSAGAAGSVEGSGNTTAGAKGTIGVAVAAVTSDGADVVFWRQH